ncbi:MAG TPA: hypothetical protein VFV31_05115 [Chitinophagaceae bacterium]|nr:hypothetical protein [Chitinophagaceae bacterium]
MMPFRIFIPAIILLSCFSLKLEAQSCGVEKEELKGTYTGGCKKGKADGKGKATGTDSYEGEFAAGLPHGKGTYKWKNGNEYTGGFEKGLKEGQGILTIKQAGKSDSIVKGYWHKDIFTGSATKPWQIIFKSKLVNEAEIEYKDSVYNKITIIITNTSGGATNIEGNELPRLKVDEIIAFRGNFSRLFVNDVHAKKTESVIEDIGYPFRFRAIIGTEEVEMEFNRPGNYVVNLRINF